MSIKVETVSTWICDGCGLEWSDPPEPYPDDAKDWIVLISQPAALPTGLPEGRTRRLYCPPCVPRLDQLLDAMKEF